MKSAIVQVTELKKSFYTFTTQKEERKEGRKEERKKERKEGKNNCFTPSHTEAY
jgi:hypothetical protein